MQLNEVKARILNAIRNLEMTYTIDTTELGKVMTVTSLSILLISAHAALSLQHSLTEVENANEELERINGMMSSESFQSSMEALETTAVEISEDFEQVYQGFNSLDSGINTLGSVETNMRDRYNFYRWIILVSIIGIIVGASLIYI